MENGERFGIRDSSVVGGAKTGGWDQTKKKGNNKHANFPSDCRKEEQTVDSLGSNFKVFVVNSDFNGTPKLVQSKSITQKNTQRLAWEKEREVKKKSTGKSVHGSARQTIMRNRKGWQRRIKKNTHQKRKKGGARQLQTSELKGANKVNKEEGNRKKKR